MLDVKFVIHYQIGDKKDLQNIIYKKLVKKKQSSAIKKIIRYLSPSARSPQRARGANTRSSYFGSRFVLRTQSIVDVTSLIFTTHDTPVLKTRSTSDAAL